MRIAFIITMLLSSFVALAGNKTTEVFTLDHQMSQNCEKKIKENLRFEKGISKIEVSLKTNTITITYDSAKTNTDAIIEAFKKIGFTAFIYNPECTSEEPVSCCSSPESNGCCGSQNSPCTNH